MNDKQMKQWVKERDEAIKSYDVEKFKAFYRKWQRLGVYRNTLPPDKVIEVSMRKMLCHIQSATKDEVIEAKAWLHLRGYTEDLY